MKKKRRQKTRYVSVKLPASSAAYPRDRLGNPRLPKYTKNYLRRHGKKIFNILFRKVPSTIYSELIECIREHDNQF
jgi:hypothetical protein